MNEIEFFISILVFSTTLAVVMLVVIPIVGICVWLGVKETYEER